MVPKPLLLLLVCWLQGPLAAFGQGEPLEQMTASDRLAWVTWFVKTELNHLDSAAAFLETNRLLDRAKVWDAPEIAAEIYIGQGDYLQEVCNVPDHALDIYTKGLHFANAHHLKVHYAHFLMRIARCNRQSDRIKAYVNYILAHNACAEAGFERVPHLAQFEYEIGGFLYDIEDYDDALEHLSVANLFPEELPHVRHQVLTLMGRCCLKLDRIDNALLHYQKCLQLAQEEQDTACMGSASVNIGACHLLAKRYAEARYPVTKGSKWSALANQPAVVARASVLLAQVHLQKDNVYAAAHELEIAEGLLQQEEDRNLYVELCQGWVSVHERRSNYREALRYRLMEDSMQRLTDNDSQRNPSNSVVKLEGRRQVLRLAQQQKSDNDDQQYAMLLICLAAMLGTGLYLSWKNQQRRQADLASARQWAEQLEKALQQVNNQRADEARLLPADHLELLSPDQEVEQARQAREQILQLVLLTDNDSRDFRQIVEKIHPGFLAGMRTRFPDLTPSETRLLALTKLNLSSKEISEILNITPNSVRRMRNRMRQKFGLRTGENLEVMLTNA